MLAYAAHRRSLAQRGSAPNAMLVIIAVHVAGIAALMSAKMDIPIIPDFKPTIVDLIPAETPPPRNDPPPPDPAPQNSTLDRPVPLVPTPPVDLPATDPTPMPLPDLSEIIRPAPQPQPPRADPVPPAPPVRVGPRLLTAADRLKPPYPASKLASGEEALLRLRLSIDASGRVTAVDPVGPADGAFLAAARRHLIAHWRYRPATEGGRALATTMVITLRFQLEG
ncbi:energy transducer TonB [Sphingomonas lutea]|uniref:Energy transducer TonB n=1 Tax=Sphingomonas lutea TaxID=1045317 RepID=A0A7G9SIL6_9SPHN|nr:energy transducer TonB [Sphingomonas lutea]QNN67691.1 energy transducer TonB [Sphingomonas lutea]